MWPRKADKSTETPPFPGEACVIDGHGAVYAAESGISDVLVVHALGDFAELTGPLRRLVLPAERRFSEREGWLRQVEEAQDLLALTTGAALSGLRAGALASSFARLHESLCAAAGKRLSCVVNLTCRAGRRQAAALHGAHDDYHDAARAGWFQLFAANVQEVADFTVIAHRIAEQTLTPGICAQDFYATSHSVQRIRLPEPALLRAYLGRGDDVIDTPTPAQALLFGARRRRVPILLDRDRPAGIGGVQDRDSYYRAAAAQRPFFLEPIEDMAERAMREFGALCGRDYAPASGYRIADADIVILAQGAVIPPLQAVADHLRREEKIKAGVVNLSMLRPFPGARLTQLLEGKQAVTVLERVDQPLAGDTPLALELRAALDKALENGRARPDHPPYPGYARFRRAEDRPAVCSAVYALGTDLPGSADLIAVYRNMCSAGMRRFFYLGLDFGERDRRFPQVQALAQTLQRSHPGLAQLGLRAAPDEAPVPLPPRVQLASVHALALQGLVFAGNLFAQTLAEAFGWNVASFPVGGLTPSLQPASLSIAHGPEGTPLPSRPAHCDALLLGSARLIAQPALLAALRDGGRVLLESNSSPERLWQAMPRRIAQLLRHKAAQLHIIDARRIAAETASQTALVDQLAIWALFGAYLKTGLAQDAAVLDGFIPHLQARLERLFGAQHFLNREISAALIRGAEEALAVPQPQRQAGEAPPVPEPEAPWTVPRIAGSEGNVFDVQHFWRSVGYLYDRGQAEEAFPDPAVATGILPARSSAFRDLSPYRLRIPEWLPENCTGCTACWAACPDSALPPTVQTVAAYLEAAFADCAARGVTLVQMKRLQEPLAKQAYRLFAEDERRCFTRLGTLLREAFERTLERMAATADKRAPLEAEFEQLVTPLRDLPVARTEAFFDAPQARAKGSGRLLSIALNPMNCTGCGLCLAVCPDAALTWAEQTPERLQDYRRNWQLQLALPRVADLPESGDGAPDEVHAPLYRLFDAAAYHALVGGDGAVPGDGAKIALHLLSAAIESVMGPRFEAHADRLTKRIDDLERLIQSEVAGTLAINDFDRFTQRLAGLDGTDLSAEGLARVLGEGIEPQRLAPAQLKRLGTLLDALKAQRACYRRETGRARMILSIDPGAGVFWSGTYPFNPHAHPWVSQGPGEAPMLAAGLFDGLTRSIAPELQICREAERRLAGAAGKDDALAAPPPWRDFTAAERGLLPPVVVVCRRESCDWTAVAQRLSDPAPLKILILDDVGLTVPAGPATDASAAAGLQAAAWAARGAFVVQTTVGHPGHLVRGVVDALAYDGPAVIHVYAPDPLSCGIAADQVVAQAARACEARVFPLLRIDPRAADPRPVLADNPGPQADWVERELSFLEPSGVPAACARPFTVADWALAETRFRSHFTILPKGGVSAAMRPLADYLDLAPEERAQIEPYIEFSDDDQRHLIAVVSPAMATATARTRRSWRALRAAAAGETPRPDRLPAAPAPETPPSSQAERCAQQRLAERLLQLCGYRQDPDFFKRSLREFIDGGASEPADR